MKKSRKTLIIRLVSGLVALALIIGVIIITTAFVGNPISSMLANKAVKEYVKENYSHLDLQLDRAKYDFKSSNYYVKAKSKTSIDTHFSISYYYGEIVGDDYQDYVLDGFNTLHRLSKEYSQLAQDTLIQELAYKDIHVSVIYGKENYQDNKDIIKLDMEFDKTLDLDPEISISLDLEDNSLDTITEFLNKAHKVLTKDKQIFKEYSIYSESKEGKLINVSGVTPEDIESGELLERLIKAKEREDKERKEIQELSDKEDPKALEEYHKNQLQEKLSVFIKE